MHPDALRRLRRRIEDYLRKYATDRELVAVARLLGIKTEEEK
jgi:hypothetical protein